MLSALGHLAAEARDFQQQQTAQAQQDVHRRSMNRQLLFSGVSSGYGEENPFARRGSLASGLALGHSKKRPKIDFFLEDQPADFRIPSYTTRERIFGHVEILAGSDVAFDDLHISLQGTSRTWVEKIATTAPTNPRTRAFHTFLRLQQPIEESEMPESHILRAGRTYKIPFEFVVPERLLPQTCSHPRENSHVEEEHLKLPPSLGDAMVSGDGKSLHGDHAPEMTTIIYSLRCILSRAPTSGTNRRPVLLADEQKKLRIIPTVDELAPLAITNEPGEDYVVRRTKTIKKGILMGKTKIGQLDVQAKQPAALRLPEVRSAANPVPPEPVTTMINVKVRFDALKGTTKPPKLQNLWSRLKVATFFATVPQKSIPSKSASFSAGMNKGLMVETLPLSALCLGGLQWVKHTAERRDSGFAWGARNNSVDEGSSPDESPMQTPIRSPLTSPATTPAADDTSGYVYYTADITVPIELPVHRHAFVPTFHSCLVSRVYALDLTLSTTTGAANSASVHLKVPVQVTSTSSESAVPLDGMIPEGGFASARAEHDDLFAPNMARGDDDEEAPPDFDELSISEDGIAAEAAARAAAHNAAEAPELDSDGEIDFRRPTWTRPDAMPAHDPARLAAQLDCQHLEEDVSNPGSPGTQTPVGARSPSPRQARPRLTNDQILNTEDYDEQGHEHASPEAQFGSFSFEPQNFARPGEGINRGEVRHGEWRRASEVLPPGYASVAAGTMLMGSGGMVRALS